MILLAIPMRIVSRKADYLDIRSFLAYGKSLFMVWVGSFTVLWARLKHQVSIECNLKFIGATGDKILKSSMTNS